MSGRESMTGKGEGFTDTIRIYEKNFSSSSFKSHKLEPKTTSDSIIEYCLMNKGLVMERNMLSDFCLVEAEQNYEIVRILTGAEPPFPSMENLEANEMGSFLLRKRSFAEGLIQQRKLEASLMDAALVEDAQRLLDELLARVTVNFEVPDFRRASQDNERSLLADMPYFEEFSTVRKRLVEASRQQRRAELKNAEFDTENQKGRQVMKRRTTTKLSNFFGVSKREAEVATIRTKIKEIDLEDDEDDENAETGPAAAPGEKEDIEEEKRTSKGARERQRTIKLASFFGVDRSEVEIRELRKLLDNIDSEDNRDSTEFHQLDAKRQRSQSTLSIGNFLKKKLIPDPPLLYQVRSNIDVDDVGKRMKESIRKQIYRFRFVNYYNCFTGRDAVDWMTVNSLPSGTIGRQEATALGNLLLQKGVINHILKKHAFHDRTFYYQFTDESGPTSKPLEASEASSASLIDIPVDNIRKEGWLSRFDYKKKEWKRYWCSVEPMILNIRTEAPLKLPKEQQEPSGMPFKSLHLEGCTFSTIDPKKFTFQIQKPNSKTALFAADSAEQVAQWVNALKIASRIHNFDRTPDGRKVMLSDFEFLKVIGKGTSGKVILCVEKCSGNAYAMKILKKADIQGPRHVKGARVEQRVLKELRHPFIVQLHYSFQTEDRLMFVMDYLSGGELFHHICEQGAFSENRARFYAAEILMALQYLHSNGIIYRDLKLENIMMDREGHIKITDFGMCKDELRAGMKTNTICGTSEYLPPEIILRTRYGPSVDWWAFGVVLFEMLCGEHPFYSEDKETLYTNILYKPIEFPEGLSDEAKSLLQGLLERDPEDRLGCAEHRDGEDIMMHPFFARINFSRLLRREIPAPFVPQLSAMTDVSYFDQGFTDMPLVLTPQDQGSVFENKFDGFSFVADRANDL